jgi:Ca-activated chloride channel homolog
MSLPPQIELILDASGSMKRKIDGRMMMDAAKDAMLQIIKSLPDAIQVARRICGHRIRERQKGDCQDSELMSPVPSSTNHV